MNMPFQKLLKLLEINAPRSKHYIDANGFGEKEGFIRMSINPKLINKFKDTDKYRPPVIETEMLNPTFKTTIFIELEDKTDFNKHDIAIFPVELDMEGSISV